MDSVCNNSQGWRGEDTARDPALDEPSKITAVNEVCQLARPSPHMPFGNVFLPRASSCCQVCAQWPGSCRQGSGVGGGTVTFQAVTL